MNNSCSASSFIIKRDCSSCDNEHKQIFYKRLTILPSTVSPYDLFLTTWASTSNELNEDFELYSSLEEVHQEHNKWTSCNYDDVGIGFPRDCGKNGEVHGQWNSFHGGQEDYQYSVLLNPLCVQGVQQHPPNNDNNDNNNNGNGSNNGSGSSMDINDVWHQVLSEDDANNDGMIDYGEITDPAHPAPQFIIDLFDQHSGKDNKIDRQEFELLFAAVMATQQEQQQQPSEQTQPHEHSSNNTNTGPGMDLDAMWKHILLEDDANNDTLIEWDEVHDPAHPMPQWMVELFDKHCGRDEKMNQEEFKLFYVEAMQEAAKHENDDTEQANHFNCDYDHDFLMFKDTNQPPPYHQISLTDGCKNVNGEQICDDNPVYGGEPNIEKAIEYCKKQCDTTSECTGLAFQEHGNGHQICITYTIDFEEEKNNLRYTGGHQNNGAVCIVGEALEMCGEMPCQYCNDVGCCTSDPTGSYCKNKHPNATDCPTAKRCKKQVTSTVNDKSKTPIVEPPTKTKAGETNTCFLEFNKVIGNFHGHGTTGDSKFYIEFFQNNGGEDFTDKFVSVKYSSRNNNNDNDRVRIYKLIKNNGKTYSSNGDHYTRYIIDIEFGEKTHFENNAIWLVDTEPCDNYEENDQEDEEDEEGEIEEENNYEDKDEEGKEEEEEEEGQHDHHPDEDREKSKTKPSNNNPETYMCGQMPCQYCDNSGCCTSDPKGTFCKNKNSNALVCNEPRPCHNHYQSFDEDDEMPSQTANLEDDDNDYPDSYSSSNTNRYVENNTEYIIVEKIIEQKRDEKDAENEYLKQQNLLLAGVILYLSGIVSAFFFIKCFETFCGCCYCIHVKDEDGNNVIVVTPRSNRRRTSSVISPNALTTPKSNKLKVPSSLTKLNIGMRSISKELDAVKKSPFASSPLGLALKKIGIRVEI